MPTNNGTRRRSCRLSRPHRFRGPGFRPACTLSGAVFPSKKTLNSPQNLENKGSEFLVPPRSMVLKVVRGKIFETLELRDGVLREVRFLKRRVNLGDGFALTIIARGCGPNSGHTRWCNV